METYTSHVKAPCRWLAETYPSVSLGGVTKFQVRAWLLQEATRGIRPLPAPMTCSSPSFYRFPVAERLSDENPAAAVTLPSPVRPRFEFNSDPEADAIIEWALPSRVSAGRWVAWCCSRSGSAASVRTNW